MRAIKKPIVLRFFFALKTQTVQTLEGAVIAVPGDAILTGTQGEQWPIARDRFENTYHFSVETGTCSKKPIIVSVEEMSHPFEVEVGWSKQPIRGKAGDYKVRYGPEEFGVVARAIFLETYDLLEV